MYFQVSGNAPHEYPVETFFGIIYCSNNEIIEIPQQYPFKGDWGIPQTSLLEGPKEYHGPFKLDLVYLSIIEQKFYSIEVIIPHEKFINTYAVIRRDKKESIPYLVIGMAPYGLISVWFANSHKTILISSFSGKEIQVTMNLFRANRKDVTLNDVCADYIDKNYRTNKIGLLNILPKKDLFAKYMQQFTYGYLPLFEKYNDVENVKWQKYKEDELQPQFEYIEESLFDGTFDKLHDDGLLKYHEAGKPKKLAIKWHIKKSEYTAYFWFEDEKICSIFERFYGAHPDTKTDFIIRIDAEKKKYELALFRQGLKEPQIIPEDAYQLLVFKNKFEHYRSDNYNQERGAWIW